MGFASWTPILGNMLFRSRSLLKYGTGRNGTEWNEDLKY